MHGSVRGLGSDIFVQRIPGDTLNVVLMFSDLANELTYVNISV